MIAALATLAPIVLAAIAVPVLADSALRWLSAFALLRRQLRALVPESARP